jgi:hypothetical protein
MAAPGAFLVSLAAARSLLFVLAKSNQKPWRRTLADAKSIRIGALRVSRPAGRRQLAPPCARTRRLSPAVRCDARLALRRRSGRTSPRLLRCRRGGHAVRGNSGQGLRQARPCAMEARAYGVGEGVSPSPCSLRSLPSPRGRGVGARRAGEGPSERSVDPSPPSDRRKSVDRSRRYDQPGDGRDFLRLLTLAAKWHPLFSPPLFFASLFVPTNKFFYLRH